MDRKEIIAHANQLFYKEGIRAVTMDQIAKSLSISKRTLYQTFKDKDTLLYECILQGTREYKSKALEVLNSAANIIEGMQFYAAFHVNEMKNMAPCYIDDLQKYHPKVYQKVEEHGEIRNSEITYTILRKARNQGYFRKDFNMDVANLFIHKTGDFFNHHRRENSFSIADLMYSTIVPFLRGLCTEKGVIAFEKTLEEIKNLK